MCPEHGDPTDDLGEDLSVRANRQPKVPAQLGADVLHGLSVAVQDGRQQGVRAHGVPRNHKVRGVTAVEQESRWHGHDGVVWQNFHVQSNLSADTQKGPGRHASGCYNPNRAVRARSPKSHKMTKCSRSSRVLNELADRYLDLPFMSMSEWNFNGSPLSGSDTVSEAPFNPDTDDIPKYALHLWPIYRKSGCELYTLATHRSERTSEKRMCSMESGELSDTVYVLTEEEMRSGEWSRMVDVPEVRELYEMRGEATIPNGLDRLSEAELAELAELVHE